MRRSSAFLAVILVLAAIRILARGYFDTLLTTQQTAGIFFILAFGMIVIWRGKMLFDFRRLTADPRSQRRLTALNARARLDPFRTI